jgi:polysaccharide biosynthesis/export protein
MVIKESNRIRTLQTVEPGWRSRYRLIYCMLIVSIASVCFGQNSALQIGESSPTVSQFEQMFGMSQLQETTDKTFFEGAVDPDSYHVGPGDRFKVYFWKPAYTEYQAIIGAEGEIALPLVGSVNVANMTLAEAKQAIQDAVGSAMKKGGLTVTLVEPRRFRIHVTGQVNMPGTYVAPATARVSDAIVLAKGLKHERSFDRGDTSWTITSSQRRIEMLNAKGEQIGQADMLLFLNGGRLDANPMLIDGVTVHVPYPDETDSRIGIFGSVNEGGRFEYVEGDQIKDALALAGGLTSLADASSIQVFSSDSQTPRLVDLTIADNESLPLKPGDRVYVQGRPDTSRNGSVTVTGQIQHPGGYPIINGVTTLADLLEQCGGFTEDAAANSARLIRKNGLDLTKNERFRISLSDRVSRPEPAFPADPELAAEFARWDYGTVVIDLSGKGEPAPSEVVLQDGDMLEVPSEPIGVRVLGFVNNGGEVPWIEGGRLNDYLALAGGSNKGGWKNRTVVIKASNGSQIWYGRRVSIDPGDIVFIPSKPETTNWEMFKDAVSVTAQLATLALVIQNVSK